MRNNNPNNSAIATIRNKNSFLDTLILRINHYRDQKLKDSPAELCKDINRNYDEILKNIKQLFEKMPIEMFRKLSYGNFWSNCQVAMKPGGFIVLVPRFSDQAVWSRDKRDMVVIKMAITQLAPGPLSVLIGKGECPEKGGFSLDAGEVDVYLLQQNVRYSKSVPQEGAIENALTPPRVHEEGRGPDVDHARHEAELLREDDQMKQKQAKLKKKVDNKKKKDVEARQEKLFHDKQEKAMQEELEEQQQMSTRERQKQEEAELMVKYQEAIQEWEKEMEKERILRKEYESIKDDKSIDSTQKLEGLRERTHALILGDDNLQEQGASSSSGDGVATVLQSEIEVQQLLKKTLDGASVSSMFDALKNDDDPNSVNLQQQQKNNDEQLKELRQRLADLETTADGMYQYHHEITSQHEKEKMGILKALIRLRRRLRDEKRQSEMDQKRVSYWQERSFANEGRYLQAMDELAREKQQSAQLQAELATAHERGHQLEMLHFIAHKIKTEQVPAPVPHGPFAEAAGLPLQRR